VQFISAPILKPTIPAKLTPVSFLVLNKKKVTPVPDLEARRDFLTDLLANANVHPDVSVSHLATLTAGRTPVELKAVLANAGVLAVHRGAEQLETADFETVCFLHR